jgi:hypothetical protein
MNPKNTKTSTLWGDGVCAYLNVALLAKITVKVLFEWKKPTGAKLTAFVRDTFQDFVPIQYR